MDALAVGWGRVKQRLERYFRERCLHRVVKNDGVALRQLMEAGYPIEDFKHKGNFVFEMKPPRIGTVLIWTEPADEDGEYIKITGFSFEP